MNWLSSMLSWFSLARRVDGPRVSEATPGWLFGNRETASGVCVDESQALTLSAVYAGVSLLSDVIGALPRGVYRRSGDRREEATSNPASRVIGTRLNPETSAAAGWAAMHWNKVVWGDAYAEIQWAGSGAVAALWPLESWRVKPGRLEDGSLAYRVDGERWVAAADMVHVPHTTADGVVGRGIVHFGGEDLGLALATREYAARYFGSGAKPGGMLVNEKEVPKQARDEFRKSWEARHKGVGRSHGTAVLWGGWKYETDGGDSAEAAQLLEQRRFGVEEVARWLNIPPHLLRDLSRATFSNIEHQGIDFVTYSIGPQLVRYEQEIDHKLLNAPGLYCKHNVAGLLRGDHAGRSSYYTAMRNIGVYSTNDIRGLEDMNPVEGGDVLLVPLAMQRLEDAAKGVQPAAKEQAPAPTKPLTAKLYSEDQPRDEHGRFGEGGGSDGGSKADDHAGGHGPEAAKQEARDKEDAEREAAREKEDAEIVARRDAEDEADARVERELVARREAEDAEREQQEAAWEGRDARREEEDVADEEEVERVEEKRQEEDDERDKVRQEEDDERDAEREAQDAERDARREAEDQDVEDRAEREEITDAQRIAEHAANDRARAKEDAATEKAREKEDAAREKERAAEDAQWQRDRDAEDEEFARGEKGRLKERAAEDKERARREKEYAARDRERDREDAAREKEVERVEREREKEDAAIDRRREKEDREVERKRKAEDAK